jgi:hypothetical protein
MKKYSLYFYGVTGNSIREFIHIFPYHHLDLQDGFKYLDFFIKPNHYQINDWRWLITKVEKIIKLWCNSWLSKGGRLVLVKVVLEEILVILHSLYFIPKGVLEKIRRIIFGFLWARKKE